MDIKSIRGSHLDTFHKCQLWFKLVAYDKRVPDIIVPAWAQLGWLIHRTMEECLKAKKPDIFKIWKIVAKKRLDIVREEVMSSWPDLVLEDKQIPEFVCDTTRLIRMLNHGARFAAAAAQGDKIELEIPLQMDLEDGFVLTGRMDLLVHVKHDMHLFDWKSTKPAWEYKTIPPQLVRYGMLVSHAYNVPISRIVCHICNLDSGNVVTRRLKDCEFDEAKEVVMKTVRAIWQLQADKAIANPDSHCKTLCGYMPSCRHSF